MQTSESNERHVYVQDSNNFNREMAINGLFKALEQEQVNIMDKPEVMQTILEKFGDVRVRRA